MLLQFLVENFLSFREETVLSLLAADGVEHQPQHVVDVGGRKVLRTAAIYGANASGKSNLLKALAFALRLIRQGTKSDGQIAVRPFKLDADSKNAPCHFEFEMNIGGDHYSYGFEVTQNAVRSEWLHRGGGAESMSVFERETKDAGEGSTVNVEIGAGLSIDEDRRKFLGFVAEGTRPNQLFLTEARERNAKEFDPVVEALRAIQVIQPNASYAHLVKELSESDSFRKFIAGIMRAAGTGLEEFAFHKDDMADMPKGFAAILSNAHLLRQGDAGLMFRGVSEETVEIIEMRGVHRTHSGDAVEFKFEEESDGTRRLLNLAPVLYRADKTGAGDAVEAIDELERSLHPLLTQLFVKQFLAAGTSKKSTQLLFTTHDTNLLDLTLLSRDSIWFMEKDATGGSHLHSLAEFNAEQLDGLGKNLEQGYLQGRFGAIPFFGSLEKLRGDAGSKG